MLSFHIVFSAHLPLVFLLLPPMLWAGLRFGMLATAMEIALLSTMALHATVSGHGPYAHSAASLAESLLMVQSFLVLASAGAKCLGVCGVKRPIGQRVSINDEECASHPPILGGATDDGRSTVGDMTDVRKIPLGAMAQQLGIELIEATADRVVGTMPVEGNTQPEIGRAHV